MATRQPGITPKYGILSYILGLTTPSCVGAEQLESRWDRSFFYGQGMGDRGPKACGPCVALASRECQANPNPQAVYARVPEEYRIQHSLNAFAAV